jgi:hypothetical protein
LNGVLRGGGPNVWFPAPFAFPNTDANKKLVMQEYGLFQTEDPLFFYSRDKKGDPKIWRMDLGANPYHFIAQWNADELSSKLEEKWGKMLSGHTEPANILFIEQKTGGTAQSFIIRKSDMVVGYREDFLINQQAVNNVAQLSEDVLTAHWKLSGMFTKNGTLKMLADNGNSGKRDDVLGIFWENVKETLEKVNSGQITDRSTIQMKAKKSAIDAIQKGITYDSVNIEALLKAENKLWSMQF